MRPIEYIDYDKLSDDILYLGSKLYLRMNVSLSSKDQDNNERHHFHKEYSYGSKYSKTGLLSIKRSFAYYLSLELIDKTKAIVIIRSQDMILLKEKLADVSVWFNDDTFGTRGTKLFVRRKREPVILSGLANESYLQFNPVAIVNESTGNQTPGVRITLSNESAFADVDVDHFFSLLYTIDNFNMYLSAQVLINYLGKPNFGMNLVEIEDLVEARREQKSDTLEGGIDNRSIPKKNKSFFEKMNEIKNSEE